MERGFSLFPDNVPDDPDVALGGCQMNRPIMVIISLIQHRGASFLQDDLHDVEFPVESTTVDDILA